mgnify:CR=1 FL=1
MKYYGAIGYAETVETSPGVWEEVITERYYYGDVEQVRRRTNDSQKVNSDVDISNTISVVADAFAIDNFVNIRYTQWLNHKWKVSNVEVAPPRLIFSVGGLYEDVT